MVSALTAWIWCGVAILLAAMWIWTWALCRAAALGDRMVLNVLEQTRELHAAAVPEDPTPEPVASGGQAA